MRNLYLIVVSYVKALCRPRLCPSIWVVAPVTPTQGPTVCHRGWPMVDRQLRVSAVPPRNLRSCPAGVEAADICTARHHLHVLIAGARQIRVHGSRCSWAAETADVCRVITCLENVGNVTEFNSSGINQKSGKCQGTLGKNLVRKKTVHC